jgi:hypothetical protein
MVYVYEQYQFAVARPTAMPGINGRAYLRMLVSSDSQALVMC